MVLTSFNVSFTQFFYLSSQGSWDLLTKILTLVLWKYPSELALPSRQVALTWNLLIRPKMENFTLDRMSSVLKGYTGFRRNSKVQI